MFDDNPIRRTNPPEEGYAAMPCAQTPNVSSANPRLPPAIPDHDLIRQIGGGSYGDVWLVRNIMGDYRAAKIIYRASFESGRPYEREFDGIRRFEPISRSHPSQVNILHIGKAEGCFYYVMELADDAEEIGKSEPQIAKGRDSADAGTLRVSDFVIRNSDLYVPRTLKLELSRRRRLPAAECLKIGLALTTALEHLHQHGLVHRDVKPSNVIFVNGIPKLADIGLVTGVDVTRSLVGTEGFIPPEGPGTPQADIYALGKVLYEISTGKDRHDFPEPPTNLAELDKFPDREQWLELDEVIQKACAFDLRERYDSAAQMHRELLAIEAGNSVRRIHKIERRLAVLTRFSIAIAIILIAVLPGYIIALKERKEAKTNERKAMAEAAKSQQVAKFLEQMLAGVRPKVALGRDTTIMKEIVDQAVDRLGKDLKDQPEVESELRDTLAATYDDLGLYKQEWDLAKQNLEFARSHFKGEHTSVAAALVRFGLAQSQIGKGNEGEPFIREGLVILIKLLGPENDDVAASLHELGRVQSVPAHAEVSYRESLRIYRKLHGQESRQVTTLLNDLGLCLYRQNKYTDAEMMLKDALEVQRRLFGDTHPDVAQALNNLALVFKGEEKLPQAEALYRESLEIGRRTYGPEHRYVSITLYNLATVLRTEGRLSEAESIDCEAVTVARKQSRTDWLLPLVLNGLASTLLAEENLVESEQVLREALEVRREVMGGEDSNAANPLANLAYVLERQGRYEEAEPFARRSLALREAAVPDDWRTFNVRSVLGASLAAQGKFAEAEPLLLIGYEGMKQRSEKMPGEAKLRLKEALQSLVQLYQSTDRPQQARDWNRKLDDF